jgi:hypothetical protein
VGPSTAMSKSALRTRWTLVASLFCVSVVRADLRFFCFTVAHPKDLPLLALQRIENAGVFSCDNFAVLSNVTSAVTVKAIHRPLDTPYGGVFNASLSAPLFLGVWRWLSNHAPIRQYDYVVKVDPDSVFSLVRLRHLLQRLLTSGELRDTTVLTKASQRWLRGGRKGNPGVWIVGPIEVLPQKAVVRFLQPNVLEQCQAKMELAALVQSREFPNPASFLRSLYPVEVPQTILNIVSSDKYMSVEVDREMAKWLLEDHFLSRCLQLPGLNLTFLPSDLFLRWFRFRHVDCSSGHVAFHPLKTARAWKRCHMTVMDST